MILPPIQRYDSFLLFVCFLNETLIRVIKAETTNLTFLPLCLAVVGIRTREIAVQVCVIESFILPIGRMIVKLGSSLTQMVMSLKTRYL